MKANGSNTPWVRFARPAPKSGFTLVELLVVVAIIAILAGLLLPGLGRVKTRAVGTQCFSNLRQLGLALQTYTADADDALPYNMGTDGIHKTVQDKTYLNWVNNVMSWELDSENTNTTLLTTGGLGPYCSGETKIYKCPSDNALSTAQREAGWSGRTRSVSMNAMLGYAGEFLVGSVNTNNPGYRQFFKMAEVPDPSRIFALVEEHPDSINDGYFINRFYEYEWNDLPASYHNDGANFVFADGHAEFRQWLLGSTKPQPRPDSAHLPMDLLPGERADWYWVLSRTSVARPADTVTPTSYGP